MDSEAGSPLSPLPPRSALKGHSGGGGDASAAAKVSDVERLLLTTRACALRSARNAAFALIARVVFGVLKVLVKRRGGLVQRLAGECINLNPLKWAAVVGTLGLFQPIRDAFLLLMAGLLGTRRRQLSQSASAAAAEGVADGDSTAPIVAVATSAIASAAAGTIVAQSVRVMETTTRTELALYLFVRAIHTACVAHVLPRLPAPLRDFEHYDVLAMGATGAQILYAIVFSPNSHSAAYMDFLQRCTQMTADQCSAIAGFHRAHVTPGMAREAARRGVALVSTDDMSQVCSLMHLDGPNTSCAANTLTWMARHFVRFSLPLYAPLKISTTLLFGGHKAFAKKPVAATTKLVSSIVSSSIFLTLYCGGPLVSICGTARLGMRGGWKIAALAGIACSFATFIEPKPRRLDLALYCAMHALRSAWLTMYHRGVVPRPTRSLVMALYCIAVSTILHHAVAMPHAFSPKMQSALAHVIGRGQKKLHHRHEKKDI